MYSFWSSVLTRALAGRLKHCLSGGGEVGRLHPPVILDESCLVGDPGQVGVGSGDVGQRCQLADDVVDHQPHEAQRLEVVGPGGEDLVQALQVLPEPRLHIPHRTRDL